MSAASKLARLMQLVVGLLGLSLNAAVIAAPIKIDTTINSSDLAGNPGQMLVSLYQGEEDTDPVAVQTYYPGEWKTSPDLAIGLPETDTPVRFSVQFVHTGTIFPARVFF